MWDNIPGTHQSIIENAMRIESERRARELEAATIAGFIGGLQLLLNIVRLAEEEYLPERPYSFMEFIEQETDKLINNPKYAKAYVP